MSRFANSSGRFRRSRPTLRARCCPHTDRGARGRIRRRRPLRANPAIEVPHNIGRVVAGIAQHDAIGAKGDGLVQPPTRRAHPVASAVEQLDPLTGAFTERSALGFEDGRRVVRISLRTMSVFGSTTFAPPNVGAATKHHSSPPSGQRPRERFGWELERTARRTAPSLDDVAVEAEWFAGPGQYHFRSRTSMPRSVPTCRLNVSRSAKVPSAFR